MSHRHNPPRQSPHRGRAPSKPIRATKAPKSDNSAINAKLMANGRQTNKPTAGQEVAAGIIRPA
jgi:hypothetical protein